MQRLAVKMRFGTLIALLIVSLSSVGQYLPSTDGTPVNRPMGTSNFSTDARSYYHDRTSFCWRPFQSINEVLAFLNTPEKRKGHFTIMIHIGGTLVGCDYIDGVNTAYWFKDGVADSNLVMMQTISTNVGTVTSVTSGNLLNFGTVAVGTNTSTPVFSFSLLQPTPHTFFGNNTGSTAPPSYVSIDTSDIANFYLKARAAYHAGTNVTIDATGAINATVGSGSGDASTNTASSVDGEVALFSGTLGKTIRRASGTGFAKLTAGVLSSQATIDTTDIASFANKVRSVFSAGTNITLVNGLITSTAGNGTVTSVSSGAISNFASVGVNTNTTTPALTYNLINAAAKTVWGNAGTSAATPNYVTLDTSFITNFYTKVRSLFSAGTGVSYNNGTGVITATGTGTGDASTNTASSVDNELALFSGTGGKTIKRATGSGFAKVTSGVLSVQSNIDTTDISNFYLKTRSLFSGGSGITYNNGTGNILVSGLTNSNLSGSAGITGANLSSTIALPSASTATTQTITDSTTKLVTTAALRQIRQQMLDEINTGSTDSIVNRGGGAAVVRSASASKIEYRTMGVAYSPITIGYQGDTLIQFAYGHTRGTPSISVSGAGTSPTVVVTGDDVGGVISITTGAGGTLSTLSFTLTFAATYTAARPTHFTAGNSAATGLQYLWSGSTLTTMTGGSSAAFGAFSTTYLFNYSVVQ